MQVALENITKKNNIELRRQMNKLYIYIYIYNVEDNYNIRPMHSFSLMDAWFKVEVPTGHDVHERASSVSL